MKTPTLLLLTFLGTTACLEGPPGPEGPRGENGNSPSPETVATALVRDHLDTIRGPQGEPGTPATGPTAEEVAAVLVRDHLAVITGPEGPQGNGPTAEEVAQALVDGFLPQVRGPAGAYDAVDAQGRVIGRVTGLGRYLWMEAAQGFVWMPRTQYQPSPWLIFTPPPEIRILFSNSTCDVVTGEVFVDMSSGVKREHWVDPLIIGGWAGDYGVRGTLTAPRVDGVTLLSYNEGVERNCQPLNEVRNDLVVFDTAVTLAPGSWTAPMTLVPAIQ
ncbi:MAG: hypothetical protein P1V51_19015 [Deltaproteobacteria bacterium]|nr:hypothetical protein [Deltaproteobacteria bacterium]